MAALKRLLRTLGESGRVLAGRKIAARSFTVLSDDICLVSYPRSGNTWTRFLIGNLIYRDDPLTFLNVESRLPEIYLFPDRILRRLPRPRVLKSHESFDPRYKTVIYIVRDPRDVAVSYYHYVVKRKIICESYPIDSFIPRFISAEFDIAWSWAASWGDHVLSWIKMRHGDPRFLLLRYEDMLKNTEAELAKVAALLGLDAGPHELRRAIQLSSAEHMRHLEQDQSLKWKLTKPTLQNRPFVRKAMSGNWRSVLPTTSVDQIEAAWGSVMGSLGYELSNHRDIPSFA